MNRTTLAVAGLTAVLLVTGCAYAATGVEDGFASPAPVASASPSAAAHQPTPTETPSEPPASVRSAAEKGVTAAPRPTPSPTSTPTPTAAPTPEPKPTTATPTPEPKPTTAAPAPTTPSAPAYGTGPTGSHWSTTGLNVRSAPEGTKLTTVAAHTELALSGRTLDGWSELADGRWVATRYLTNIKPAPKPTPTPTTMAPAPAPATPSAPVSTKKTETATERCERIWRQARALLAPPPGAALVCGTTTQGLPGEANSRWADYPDGRRVVTNMTATLDVNKLSKYSDTVATALGVHEIAHLWEHNGDATKRAAHYAALGTTEARYRSGSYASRPAERFAASASVCLAGTNTSAQYRPYDCTTFNRALGALR